MRWSRSSVTVPSAAAVVILIFCGLLALLTGWQTQVSVLYPVSDLPRVDGKRIDQQVEKGNVSKRETIYYRKKYAGSDTAEIR